MQQQLQNIFDNFILNKEQNNTVKKHWPLLKQKGQDMQMLIGQNSISTAIEIGTGYGISSIFIGHAIKDKVNAKLITIDPHQNKMFKNSGIGNIKDAGLFHLIEFYNDYSYYVLPDLLKKNVKVDLIFIDGYHTFDFAFVDFFYADMLLNVNGLLIIDDASWPSVKKVSEYIATNRAYELIFPEKRKTGTPTWKHKLLTSFLKIMGKYNIVDERIRKQVEYKNALEIPISPRFLAFRKIMDDKEWRQDETFHKVF